MWSGSVNVLNNLTRFWVTAAKLKIECNVSFNKDAQDSFHGIGAMETVRTITWKSQQPAYVFTRLIPFAGNSDRFGDYIYAIRFTIL